MRRVAALFFGLFVGCRGILGIDDGSSGAANGEAGASDVGGGGGSDGGGGSPGSSNANGSVHVDGGDAGLARDGGDTGDAAGVGDTGDGGQTGDAAGPGTVQTGMPCRAPTDCVTGDTCQNHVCVLPATTVDARYQAWVAAPDHPPASGYSIPKLGVVLDNTTGLSWEQTATSTAQTYADAAQYCANLDDGYGAGTWRMPTRAEFLSIVDFTSSFFVDTSVWLGPHDGDFWTLSLVPGNVTQHFAFLPNDGFPNSVVDRVTVPSTDKSWVRCVHGGAPLPASWSSPTPQNLYVQQEYGIYDAKTHLLWQHDASTSTMTLANASAYCASFNSGAGRLPTIREAHSLTDESASVTDPVWPSIFTGTKGTYWTGSVWEDADQEWVWTSQGTSDIMAPTNLAYVRCVSPQ